MKPSQRIYQQRDIAENKMQRSAWFVAKYLRHGDRADLVTHHLGEFTKWETIRNVLSTEGDIASNAERKERNAKKAAHEAAMKKAKESLEKEVDELLAKEVTHDKLLVDPFSDYVQRQLDMYFTATTNAVTLNTAPLTTSTTNGTWKFVIPRDANQKAPTLPNVIEQEVEGII